MLSRMQSNTKSHILLIQWLIVLTTLEKSSAVSTKTRNNTNFMQFYSWVYTQEKWMHMSMKNTYKNIHSNPVKEWTIMLQYIDIRNTPQ